MKKYFALLLVLLIATLPAYGITVTANSGVMRSRTITVLYTDFKSAAQTSDLTYFTLPPQSALYRVVAHLSTTFACASTCTSSTLSIKIGKSAGGEEHVLSFDADNAAGWFGDEDGELGTSINAANGPDVLTAQTALKIRLTSGTGNIGTGTATHLSGGVVSITITYITYP